MIRERRNKEKLQQYYEAFIHDGVIDPNVHPWVAESWKRSRELKAPHHTLPPLDKLPRAELNDLKARNRSVIDYLDGLYRDIHEYFTMYNLSLLLLDSHCYVLKNYAMPFFQKTPGEVEGSRLAEVDIGTSSISIALEHRAPFLIFGPEMWIEECQSGDACSAPILIDGEVQFILTVVSVQQDELPYDAIISLVLTMKYALENYLNILSRLEAKHTILDAVPLAVYHIMPDGKVVYTNKLGEKRLAENLKGRPENILRLSDVVLNYRHTPLAKGFVGVPSYNKEVTWITPHKTYEDITTVVPLFKGRDVNSIVAVSLPIEDLRTLVAHAAGYTARYSLTSLVGETAMFSTMKSKAARIAKHNEHVLIQGEAGTGKQRLAHGIHQASSRAAGPLISVKCGDIPTDYLDGELFGAGGDQEDSRPGKLELANGGTLFLDEVEKLPVHIGNRLADSLSSGHLYRAGEHVLRPIDARIIAACDSDLKRLTERGTFSAKLYHVIAQDILRVPSLRSRREDIPLLADHIIEELADQHQIKPKKFSPDAAELLMAYDWPGNIKQLQGVVEQAFFHTISETIRPENITLPGKTGPGNAWKEDKDAFVDAWKAAGGNISRLANMLDVSRVTLYRYLKKYGMEKE
jgi:DNA-binding NtrC family response regulator